MNNKIILIFIACCFYIDTAAISKNKVKQQEAKPTSVQLAFQDMELGAFFHYSIDTYATKGSKPGQTASSVFNPDQLDVEQWVRAAKEMGATFAVLTARHEQGFCLWPTSTTDYSIKNSSYRNGKGDIVAIFVRACRKYGLKPGLYTAPWIDSHWDSIYAGNGGHDTGRLDKYDDPTVFAQLLRKEQAQITELLTHYGPLVFIWDDHFGRSDALGTKPLGGKCRELYRAIAITAHKLQPECLLLGRDVEHVGTEEGRAGYPLWNSLNTIDGSIYTVSDTYHWDRPNTGCPDGKYYRPQIAPSTNALSSGGWMWNGYREPKSVDDMMTTYDNTVGRGSVLILNFAPNRHGLIDPQVVAAAKDFGHELHRRFDHPLYSSASTALNQQIDFDRPQAINQIVSMEDLSQGQKISSYQIEAKIGGEWKTIVAGQTVGHKRIDYFPTVMADAVKFTVTATAHDSAKMRSIAIYNYMKDIHRSFYLDSQNGDDTNDGLSAGKAWKSLDRANYLRLNAGDRLLLKRGCTFHGQLTISGNGTAKDSIIIDAYGEGTKPKVMGNDNSQYAILVRNSNYLTIQNIEVMNQGIKRMADRHGLLILNQDNGVSHRIHLRSLYIHDVNGTLAKHSGEGSGIEIRKEWHHTPSSFDSLSIENCIIRRCERNGITWSGGWDRQKWFPDKHTIIRQNLIEEVPGDGIVPIACDSVIVEYNLMRHSTDNLPDGDAAAGIWPWSCNNALLQFNEVSGHHAPWDGQGFDSDFNCSNTIIRYNYSHDNDGGFLLICNPGPGEATDNIGNLNTQIMYNLSINDGQRTRPTRQGMFSPIIHVAGPCENAKICKNILYMKLKVSPAVDSDMLTSDSWGGFCDGLSVMDNVFYAEQVSKINLTSSTNNHFDRNFYLGKMIKPELDKGAKHRLDSPPFKPSKMPTAQLLASHFLRKISIADGEAEIMVIDAQKIQSFFDDIPYHK